MLLRFLGEGEVRAVGASRAGHVDVRLIAATHRDLHTAVREGRFREDLYYRLRRVVLTVPPLRTRLDDLPLLVAHVRTQLNTRHRLAIDGVTDRALERLARHSWPGNVRELEAVLEEAMLMRGRGRLRPEDIALPDLLPPPTTEPAGPSAIHPPGSERRRHLALELAGTPWGVSTGELARAADVGVTLARQELGALATRGELRRTGRGRSVRYVRP
jgi:two-component system, NtrC family, response regulator PilR